MRRPPRSTLFPYTTLFRSQPDKLPFDENWFIALCAPRPFITLEGDHRSEEHTSELQSLRHLVCRLLLERCGDHRDLPSFPTRRSSDLSRTSCRSTRTGSSRCARRGPLLRSKAITDRKSTRLNSSHLGISYAVFFLKDAATTEIYPLSLHDALPISAGQAAVRRELVHRAVRAAALYYARRRSRPEREPERRLPLADCGQARLRLSARERQDRHQFCGPAAWHGAGRLGRAAGVRGQVPDGQADGVDVRSVSGGNGAEREVTGRRKQAGVSRPRPAADKQFREKGT